MAGLPSKYAKMGFARGWRAFKNSSSSARRSRAVVNKVARRKKGGSRRSRSGGGGLTATDAALYGAGYGIAQPHAYNMAAKIGINPRLTMGILGALAAWKGKGIVRKAGLVVLTTEAGIQARAMTSGLLTPQAAVVGANGPYL